MISGHRVRIVPSTLMAIAIYVALAVTAPLLQRDRPGRRA